jgi:hypothetical protein
MSTRVLEASLNGRVVGELRESNDLWEFEYGAGPMPQRSHWSTQT